MSGEPIQQRSAYAVVQASASVTSGSLSAGARTTIGAALPTGSEKDWFLLDFKLKVTVGTPTENGVVVLYRIPGDGIDDAPTPSGNYLPHRVEQFVLDNATGTYFCYGVANVDPNDRFIIKNSAGATLTLELSVRSRGLGVAP